MYSPNVAYFPVTHLSTEMERLEQNLEVNGH